MNSCNFIGRMTSDPELKQTASGVAVCNFTLAVDRPGSKDKTTDFINMAAWRGTAEFICNHFRKGQRVGISGILTTRNYTDKNEQKRTMYEVMVDRASFCERPDNNERLESKDAVSNDLPFEIENSGDLPW